jgi:guanylate kinase
MKKNVVTISGKSASGKTTLSEALVETGRFEETVSFTTRKPRPGEIDGKHYHFISVEDFKDNLNKGKVLEHTQINENFYGTDINSIKSILDKKKTPVIVCDPLCPLNLEKNKDKLKTNVIPVFIQASPELLSKRILERLQAEYDVLNKLKEEGTLKDVEKHREVVEKEYSKRIQGMSDLSVKEIDFIFKKLDDINNDNGEIFHLLSTGISSPHSKEAKWENMMDYKIIIDAEELNNNIGKGVSKIKNSLKQTNENKINLNI